MDASRFFSPKSEEEAQRELEYVIHRSPQSQGFERSRWWLDGIGKAIEWLANASRAQILQMLHRFGLSYKRGRIYMHSPDHDYDLKLAYVQKAYEMAQNKPDEVVLLYQDELTYYRRPSVARGYAQRGSDNPRAYQGVGSNKKRRVCGTLNAVTGDFFAWQRARFDRDNLLNYYLEVDKMYPDAKTIFIVQDNWSVHFHPKILQGLSRTKITLLRLPTYAPWTNPIEKVWLKLKQELLHLHRFNDDWQALQDAVENWLQRCDDNPTSLLRFVGLYSVFKN